MRVSSTVHRTSSHGASATARARATVLLPQPLGAVMAKAPRVLCPSNQGFTIVRRSDPLMRACDWRHVAWQSAK
jgi:hypothetical protein